MERIIDVYYGSDCLPYKDEQCTIHFPVCGSVFLGASQTTKIRFHYYNIGNYNNVYIVESKRADGRPSFEKLTKNEEGGYAELSLSGWYSECKGDLYISLKVYMGGAEVFYNDDDPEQPFWDIQGNPVIQSTGAIKLAVNYTPVGQVEHYSDAYGTYQDVLSGLSDRLEIKNGIVAVNSLSSVNISTYDNGQLFFDVDTKNIYKLESGEFVKINNKLEIVDVEDKTYDELLDMFGTQPFMSYFEETNNISVYQFKEITGGYELHCSSQKNGLIHIPSVVLANTFSTSDFTQLDFQSAPVVELQSETGTLSDLDYEKLLQPNASLKLGDLYFIKAYEDNDLIEFYHYFAGNSSSNSYVGYHNISIGKQNKAYRVGEVQELFYDKSKMDALLNGKQDTLHSGTNIKTLTIGDNQPVSLLGSGTINIPTGGSGGSEWGQITGDIADQTDLQDELQDIREVAEGKTSTYVIYDDIEGLTEQTFVANEYKREDGTPIATWADFLSYVEGSKTCSNISFDDDSVYKIDVGYTYLITVYNRIIKTNTLKNGDNIIVVQLDVPDRWYNEEDGCAYPLETSKVNLDNYSTKSETSTEVNKVAHDIAVEYDENTLYGVGDLCIKDKLLYKCNTDNTTGTWDSTKWDLTTVNSELGIIKGDYVNLTTNQTVGGDKEWTGINTFSDLRTTGSSSAIISFDVGSYHGFIEYGSGFNFGDDVESYASIKSNAFVPSQDNNFDIGSSSYAIKDIYAKGTINPNSSGFGLSFPSTASLTANKEIATTDQAFNVINVADLSLSGTTYTLTDEQFAKMRNGKPTIINGMMKTNSFGEQIVNVIFYPSNQVNDTTMFDGYCVGNKYNDRGFGWFYQYRLTVSTTTKTLQISRGLLKIDTNSNITEIYGLGGGLGLGRSNETLFIKGKKFPNYPTTNASPRVLTIGANGGNLSWVDRMNEWYGTQAEYDALGTYDSNTIYNILES